MAERTALNRDVVGSTPTSPAYLSQERLEQIAKKHKTLGDQIRGMYTHKEVQLIAQELIELRMKKPTALDGVCGNQ